MDDYYSTFDDKRITHIIDMIRKIQKIDTVNFTELDLTKYKKDISYLYPIHNFYRFIYPILLRNKMEDIGIGDKIKDPVEKIYGEGREFSIFESHHINLDTGFFINQFIKDNNVKTILNCGTGSGSSVAYAQMGLKDVHVTTIDHMQEFSRISKFIIDILRDIGFPLGDDINYIDVDLCELKDTDCQHGYESFLFTNRFRKVYKKHHSLISYDINFENKFDMIILDGPSFFRFPTLLKAVNFLNNDGYILFEYCRQEIRIIKKLKINILEEKGRSMDKSIKIRSKGDELVRAFTVIRGEDFKKVIEPFIKVRNDI
jgi:hypothetical protein